MYRAARVSWPEPTDLLLDEAMVTFPAIGLQGKGRCSSPLQRPSGVAGLVRRGLDPNRLGVCGASDGCDVELLRDARLQLRISSSAQQHL